LIVIFIPVGYSILHLFLLAALQFSGLPMNPASYYTSSGSKATCGRSKSLPHFHWFKPLFILQS